MLTINNGFPQTILVEHSNQISSGEQTGEKAIKVFVCVCSSGLVSALFGWLIREINAAVNFLLHLCETFTSLLCRVSAKILANVTSSREFGRMSVHMRFLITQTDNTVLNK